MKKHAVKIILILAIGWMTYQNIHLTNTIHLCSRAADSLERKNKELSEFIGFITDALPEFCTGESDEVEFEIEF